MSIRYYFKRGEAFHFYNRMLCIGLMTKVIISVIIRECINENIQFGRSYIANSGSLFVSFCSFIRNLSYETDGNGGIISISSTNLNIYDSMFTNSRCSGNGGAIDSSSSNIALVRVCAYSCRSYSNGCFMNQVTNSDKNTQIQYLSLNSCSSTNSNSVMYINGGGNDILGANTSLCSAKYCTS